MRINYQKIKKEKYTDGTWIQNEKGENNKISITPRNTRNSQDGLGYPVILGIFWYLRSIHLRSQWQFLNFRR